MSELISVRAEPVEALTLLNEARRNLLRFHGDPLAPALAAKAAAPEMASVPIFLAWLYLLGTEKAGAEAACVELAACEGLEMNPQEQALQLAATQLAQGHWHAASDALLAYNAGHPLDATALQWGHQIDFFTGDASRLLERIQAAWPHWREGMEGYSAMCAMHAFGLEESGQYAEAERLGRQAVSLDPQDGWAWHAVAHVMEMQGRAEEGIAWYASGVAHWHEGGLLAVHNAWHWALFHIKLGQFDRALRIYDGYLIPKSADFVLHLIDASSLLWRLRLHDVDVGQRWEPLAERWASRAEDGHYAFNDMHAMMAFAAMGREQDAQRLLQAQSKALKQATDNAHFLRAIGQAATHAMQAHASGHHRVVIDLLEPKLIQAHHFGGSHAQREILTLTLQSSQAAVSQEIGR